MTTNLDWFILWHRTRGLCGALMFARVLIAMAPDMQAKHYERKNIKTWGEV